MQLMANAGQDVGGDIGAQRHQRARGGDHRWVGHDFVLDAVQQMQAHILWRMLWQRDVSTR